MNDEILPKSLRINKVNKVLFLWGFRATKVKKMEIRFSSNYYKRCVLSIE